MAGVWLLLISVEGVPLRSTLALAIYFSRSRIPKEECSSSASRTWNQSSFSFHLAHTHTHTTSNHKWKYTHFQLFTDILLGNTFGTGRGSQKQIWGTKWLEYRVTSKQEPRTHRKLPQQPTKQRGRVRMMIMTDEKKKMMHFKSPEVSSGEEEE